MVISLCADWICPQAPERAGSIRADACHGFSLGLTNELISMNEDAVAIMPTKLTMEEAAPIPLVGLTAWQALIERANLKKGQKVLIHGGSGGVGTFAIQLAKHLGAIVATTTSTASLDLVKSLGADNAIDYKDCCSVNAKSCSAPLVMACRRERSAIQACRRAYGEESCPQAAFGNAEHAVLLLRRIAL
jgi:D-arabinose 1-dehydrogenase-like Zn-dependent alcohol dehydrogenase